MTAARNLALLADSINSSGVLGESGGGTGTTTGYYGFKNRIINGAMAIDQRNSGASVTPTNQQYLLDRWVAGLTQASKFSAQQNAGSITPPAGFANYLGVTSLSAYSVGSGDTFYVQQRIEGYNLADLGWGTGNAKTVTLSFQVYSSLTGTFGGAIYNNGGTRSYPFTYTVSSANTWTSISITIAGDTSGTWVTNNGIGATLSFNLGAGSTYNGTAGSWASAFYTSATGATSIVGTSGATFYITGVQLEKGSTATSFDYRPYGTELSLCQRYCVVQGGATSNDLFATGSGNTSTISSQTFRPSTTFRAVPSVSYSSLSDLQIQIVGGSNQTATSISLVTAISSPQYLYIDCGIASGGVAGAVHFLRAANSNARLTFSAEL